jgi:hypothetical protein
MVTPLILLNRETYQNLVKKATAEGDKQLSVQHGEGSGGAGGGGILSGNYHHTQTIDHVTPQNEVVGDFQKISEEGDILYDILHNVSSTPLLGKLVGLWDFVKRYFRQHGMSWNEKAELVNQTGVAIKGSNIATLIRHVILSPNADIDSPTGYEDFINILARLKVPKRLLLKRRLKKQSGEGQRKATRKTLVHKLYLKRNVSNGPPGVRSLPQLESYSCLIHIARLNKV